MFPPMTKVTGSNSMFRMIKVIKVDVNEKKMSKELIPIDNILDKSEEQIQRGVS